MRIHCYVKMLTTIFYFESHNVYLFSIIFSSIHVLLTALIFFILVRDYLYMETKILITIHHRTHPEISETRLQEVKYDAHTQVDINVEDES